MRDVATSFAGRTLVIIGDSISRQWADGIQCEAEREGGLAAAATSIPLDSGELRASGCDIAFSVVRAGGDGASEVRVCNSLGRVGFRGVVRRAVHRARHTAVVQAAPCRLRGIEQLAAAEAPACR